MFDEIQQAIDILKKYNIDVQLDNVSQLAPGDLFYWVTPRDCGNVQCMAVHVLGDSAFRWAVADKPWIVYAHGNRDVNSPGNLIHSIVKRKK